MQKLTSSESIISSAKIFSPGGGGVQHVCVGGRPVWFTRINNVIVGLQRFAFRDRMQLSIASSASGPSL